MNKNCKYTFFLTNEPSKDQRQHSRGDRTTLTATVIRALPATGQYTATAGATASSECVSCGAHHVPTADRTGCVCDGGYVVCTADDAAASFSDGATSYDCSAFASGGPRDDSCVSENACTICCATCAAECAAAGEKSGCTACEAGEQAAALG